MIDDDDNEGFEFETGSYFGNLMLIVNFMINKKNYGKFYTKIWSMQFKFLKL